MIPRRFLTILAKKGRVEIIRTLKAFPDNDFSINELARVSKVPTMTAWRSVKELKSAGLVKTRKVGNSVSVRLTDEKDQLRALRLVPETDPQRSAALEFAGRLSGNGWLRECRLFGNIGRGEHSPGDEVDVAVVYSGADVSESGAKEKSATLAAEIKEETNVIITPFLITEGEMSRKGGIGSELRDREIIWKR